jgi:hypothetical protein
LYPDGLAFYVELLRIARLLLKGIMLKRLGDDVLYVRMHIRPKLMEDVPNPRIHRAIVSTAEEDGSESREWLGAAPGEYRHPRALGVP